MVINEKVDPFYFAEPPPEVVEIIKANEAEGLIDEWVSVPSANRSNKRIVREDLRRVDALELIAPLLEKKELDGSLRIMDFLDGCFNRCDTCGFDAFWPSAMFSFESLERLFNEPKFIKMLAPDFLRLGWTGDILDHPNGLEIVNLRG